MFEVTLPTPAGLSGAAVGHSTPPVGFSATMGLFGDAALPATMICGTGTLVTIGLPRKFVRLGVRCTQRIRETAAVCVCDAELPAASARVTVTFAFPPPVSSGDVRVAVEKLGVTKKVPLEPSLVETVAAHGEGPSILHDADVASMPLPPSATGNPNAESTPFGPMPRRQKCFVS
jgi:hypothetical protein